MPLFRLTIDLTEVKKLVPYAVRAMEDGLLTEEETVKLLVDQALHRIEEIDGGMQCQS